MGNRDSINNNKKRILCLIENLGSGGAERQISGLAIMLMNRGHEVEVWYYIDKVFYLPLLHKHGVVVRYLSDATSSKRRFFSLRKHIKSYCPDTIISYSASPSMVACLLKRSGMRFNLIVSERNTTQSIDVRTRLRFFLYRWSDFIVPNSFSQATFIRSHYPSLSNKVKVITNYVDTDIFTPAGSIREVQDVTKIICVGRMMPQKNLLRFIEAIGKLTDMGYRVSVDWYGQDLKDDYSAACHKSVQDSRIEGLFSFHVPSTTIQDEYLKADVFCLPSLYEGFPNVLCEAMSCGKPVLCSRVCDNPHIVKEGLNGFLFNPLDVNDMISVIVRYLNLPNESRLDMGMESREIAVRLFSKELFISKYAELV